MKCTRCKKGELRPSYIDDLLPGHTCNHCQGNWIYLSDYLRWLEKDVDIKADNETKEISLDEEKHEVMICPKTGGVMLKYRISKETDHRLDLSPAVNGIWLDKGEWELLKQEGLATSLNQIFTEPWQRKIREENAQDTFDAMYENEFGAEDHQRLKEFRTWLDSKDKKSSMLAYLTAENPYSASK